MRNCGEMNNWTMRVIDTFWADDKRHAAEREQEWVDKLKASLQMLNPIRKPKKKEFNL